MTEMFEAALAALRQIVTPPFRAVLLKSLGMTFLLLALAWVGLDKLAMSFMMVEHPWLRTALTYATGAGLFFLMAFLIAPVSVLVSGLFLDDLADHVEADLYPPGQHGRAIPATQAILMGLRFAGISAIVNFFALLLLFVPGINAAAFLLANAYLFGREYFLFAATRFRSLQESEALRRRHALWLFVAGLFIAVFVATPGLNVLTPLFAVAFMTRIHRMLPPHPRGETTPSARGP
ncbi:sulfate transporter family protein [Methylocystis rosea]|uniref:Sulfate transporter family protein n=1 Tax=Methylocystis rosea TaxID=173366 RepID=A0A3G8M7U1_9HYPH|nr:sulfate transporter family protein [Methylocystis rosea]AZG77674.1 sulfate transporter family protein [Methylocystis rosea]